MLVFISKKKPRRFSIHVVLIPEYTFLFIIFATLF